MSEDVKHFTTLESWASVCFTLSVCERERERSVQVPEHPSRQVRQEAVCDRVTGTGAVSSDDDDDER